MELILEQIEQKLTAIGFSLYDKPFLGTTGKDKFIIYAKRRRDLSKLKEIFKDVENVEIEYHGRPIPINSKLLNGG